VEPYSGEPYRHTTTPRLEFDGSNTLKASLILRSRRSSAYSPSHNR
jgi:hypothetical protein